ncbi:MAG: hypothetical protein A2W61_07990 [Deltaproteobacteria bacterium RIFCSPLOWO2_01_44_7]|nr:MAG: hypothetical protein A2712_10370 [Deltaproteobacteria bacterium RIFCSPHIGHO2_01_FULL_43_49]OGQ15513.1 MAG: hypothetical protein A3D22_10900 [Deltaproteobacteria bacterium RIFCSPHIGHO2_02_FULL_44_53]OGQ28455.1 MAG: hypothetical protein A3D98_03085 [Deltaproteobacteria bacterium RIFCSPHIGHO2_12_FULL_44_21]OGQ32319.1 MAG: hypothetical protein A2979_00745 [Deltaproteobacteria bacterium RIFCSPLOWO2_01_FULL_45_74]OGQ37682.1 MAG: hypothetical protein A2W61_07990 [Deltaproteobacteria bacterium 
MIDHIDLQAAAFCVDHYLRESLKHWDNLDWLYSEKAYLEQTFAKYLHNQGQLDDKQLKAAWNDLDSRMAVYDDKYMERRELSKYLKQLAHYLREESQRIKNGNRK